MEGVFWLRMAVLNFRTHLNSVLKAIQVGQHKWSIFFLVAMRRCLNFQVIKNYAENTEPVKKS